MILVAQIFGAIVGVSIVRGGVVIKNCNIFPKIAILCPPKFLEEDDLKLCDYT